MPALTKFSVEMTEFRKHINFVRNGLGASKTDLPVMMLRFDVRGPKLTMFAANKEVFTRTELRVLRPAEDDPDGTFGVIGAKIERLIAQVEVERLEFTSDGAENLEIRAGFLTVNFELYDSSPLKTIDVGVAEHLDQEGLTVLRDSLEEALACGKSCCIINATKPDLNHVEIRDGRCLSSDGRKIMIYQNDSFPEGLALKVPTTALPDVLNLVKNMADTETVQVFEGKSYYYIKGSGNKFTSGVRKVERSFPAIENHINLAELPTDEVSLDKNVLVSMLKGVALGLPYDDVRVQILLEGSGKEACMEISALNSVGKRSHERASCGRKLDAALVFPLSFKHLLDTLGVFQGDSVVDIMVFSSKNILMVKDVTTTRQVVTVIPFRTDKMIQDERKDLEAVAEAKKAAHKKETEPLADVETDLSAGAVDL